MADSQRPLGVVVGVDGSSWALAAVGWAVAEAVLRRVQITVVHVVKPLTASTLTWPGGRIPEEVLQIQDNDARAVIADAMNVVENSIGTGYRPEIRSELTYGGVVPTLAELSKDAEILAVGPRGRSGQHRRPLGESSSGLIRHAHCPVAIVHGPPTSRESARLPVLLGTDGSPASDLATEVAFREASWREVDLVVLHVLGDTDMSSLYTMEWSALQSSGQKPIAERLAIWEERYPDVTANLEVQFERPARQLIEASQRYQLVVVGSHGRGGFAGMLLGSVSAAVAQEAAVPVIVARR